MSQTNQQAPNKSAQAKNQSLAGVIVETVKTLIIAFIIAFLLRTFLFQSFHIPSPSMEPTLTKGDFIITTKYSLGYGKYAASPLPFPVNKGRIFERSPKRGDIIVFKPEGSKVHYVKRLVGLPGDVIQMKKGFLYINGDRQKTEKLSTTTQSDRAGNPVRFVQYREYLDGKNKPHTIIDQRSGGEVDNTGEYAVPGGHYFFMGDNRDRSLDSRYPPQLGGIGMVAATNLVSRAEFILLSVEDGFSLKRPWTWTKMRKDRFFKGLR